MVRSDDDDHQKRGDSKEVKRTTPNTALAGRSGNNLCTATSARTQGPVAVNVSAGSIGNRSKLNGERRRANAQKLVSAEVPRRVLYRVEEAVVLLGLSRSQLYELIRSGRLQTVTEGRVRLIPAAAIDAYVSLLTSEAQADTGDDAA
jgi:excisionase family DNA binding protein